MQAYEGNGMNKIDQYQNKVMESVKGSRLTLEQTRNIFLSLAYSIQEELTPGSTTDELHFTIDELAQVREEFT